MRVCVLDWRKYYDTVAVSSAIFHLFNTNPPLGRFVGVEHRLVGPNPTDTLTPDLTALYSSDSMGLLFDLKYSLSPNPRTVNDELQELMKYDNISGGWTVKPVKDYDFILVCHMNDAKRAVDAAKDIFSRTKNAFFDPSRFAIWSWTITAVRGNERLEEMRILLQYGRTRNAPLQQLIEEPGGIVSPEQVLTTLRFTQLFVRQKPPVQYTIVLLIQNVFTALPPPPFRGEAKDYRVDLDTIYRKTNALFPPWWENDVQTVQVKKQWVREALDTLVGIDLVKKEPGGRDSYIIPIPTLKTRKPLHEAICEKLTSLEKVRRPRGRPPGKHRPREKERPVGVKPLTEFFGRGSARLSGMNLLKPLASPFEESTTGLVPAVFQGQNDTAEYVHKFN